MSQDLRRRICVRRKVKKIYLYLLLFASIFASIAGIVLFVILFVPDFNIYWLIISPIIIALYQAPAAYLFYLYRKTKHRIRAEESEPSEGDEI
jgi:cytochrome b subunit of formate dehydrogenase